MNKKYYAGIGSRDTEPAVQKLMTEIAAILETKGYILRSGHATGADLAFELGVRDDSAMNIYLPYEGFNNAHSYDSRRSCYIYIPDDMDDPNYARAYESLRYHPKGYDLSPRSKQMMTRNFFQVHGMIGEPSSEFIICWTPNGALVGGTAQAMRLSKAVGIRIYNLATMFRGCTAEYVVDTILANNGVVISDKKIGSLF